MIERVTITFTKDGKFRGASATDFDDLPVPLSSAELKAVVPTLNTAALARATELEAELSTKTEEHATCVDALENIRSVVVAAQISSVPGNEVPDLELIVAKADAALSSEDEKKAAALEAQIAEANAKLSALRTPSAVLKQ